MRLLSKFLFVVLLFASCSENEKLETDSNSKFRSELTTLKEYFHIPGMAVLVSENGNSVYEDYFGYSNIKGKTELDASIIFPIASLTKIFAGVLLMKLVEEHKVSLEEPINKYYPASTLSDSVLIKHIFSHTSQGKVGTQFYYSSRFGMLTKVIEQGSGTSFSDYMDQVIFKPLQLKNTFLLKDSTQIKENNHAIANPYVLEDVLKDGFIDFGYSASAGVASTLRDLNKFDQALDENKLISKNSKEVMFQSFVEGSPYGYGIFSQSFLKEKLVWGYGQYDCYSSLYLKVPSKNLTLILLANNNLMSDPARLINGDVTTSLFALSFLKNYVFEKSEMELFENADSIKFENVDDLFFRKKLLAQALAEAFMARFNPEKFHTSVQIFKSVFEEYPNYLDYADLTTLHNLSFLKTVAFHLELGELNDFNLQIESIGEKLLSVDANNPYANYYLGAYYADQGNIEKAKFHYGKIVDAKNFSKWWYTSEAMNWLKQNEN